MSRRTRISLIAAAVLLSGCGSASAQPTSAYRPFSGPWRPVAVPEATPAASEAPEPLWGVMPPPAGERETRTSAPPQIRVVKNPVKASPRQPSRSGRSITGVATWYCKPGVSRCTYGYAWNGPYAAAGPALRAALGPHYKGRHVWVNGVEVVLIDWCACGGGHVIDVYWNTWRTIPNPDRAVVTW